MNGDCYKGLRYKLWVYRDANKLSQRSVGDLAGVNQGHLSRYERGLSVPAWVTDRIEGWFRRVMA